VAKLLDTEDRPRTRLAKHRAVRVGRTSVGKGVFASRRYRPDDLIGEIAGELIADPGYTSDYCFDLEDGRQLEPAPPFRFINHSCEPNCEFDFSDLADGPDAAVQRHVLLWALQDIAPGEELRIDYNWSAEGAIPCRCQAPTCRGWIVRASQLAAVLARQHPRA
jgi:hypothetical protein